MTNAMNEPTTDPRSAVIQQWVDEWIIKENFCPFAYPAKQQDRINVRIIDSADWSQIYQALFDECKELINSSPNATTLLVLPQGLEDFFSYLSLLEGAESILEREQWTGVFQLASFHPDYLFEGEPSDSPSHYTNRSPLPIIHIIKESDVTRVMPSEQHADEIVQRNIAKLKHIGTATAKRKLTQWQNALSKLPNNIG